MKVCGVCLYAVLVTIACLLHVVKSEIRADNHSGLIEMDT